MAYMKFLGEDGAMFKIMGHRNGRLRAIGALAQAILRGPSELSAAEREFLSSYVSGLNACRYCYGSHAATAVALGVDEQVIQAAIADPDTAPVEARMKPLLHYLRKLTLSPAHMTQADADAVYAAGWSEDALSDAVAVCALFNFANRIIDGHGVSGERSAEFFKLHGERLARDGYSA